MNNKMLGILCIAGCFGLHIFLWWSVDGYKYSGAILPARLLNLFPARHLEDIADAAASATLWVGSLIWVAIGVAIAYLVHTVGTVNRRKV